MCPSTFRVTVEIPPEKRHNFMKDLLLVLMEADSQVILSTRNVRFGGYNTEFVVFTEKRQIWRPIRRLIRRLFFHQKVRFRGQLRGCAVHQKRSHHRGRFKGYLEPRKHQNSIVWVARKFIIFTQFGGSTSKMISHQIPSWTRFDSLVFYLFHRFRGRLGY